MRTNDVLKGLGVVGAAVAAYFLLEPRNGSRRRKKIATMGRDLYDGAGQELGRLGGEISRLSSDVGSGLSSVVGRVGEMTGLSSGRSSSSSNSGGGNNSGGKRRSGNSGGRRRRATHSNGEATTQQS